MKNLTGALLGTGLLLALAIGAYGVKLWRAAAKQAEGRTQLLAEIDGELAKVGATQSGQEGSELGALLVRLRRDPEHTTDPELVLAAARLERARGHDQQAFDLLAPRIDHDQPSLAELREATLILQRLYNRTGDRSHARQAQSVAERAYASSHASMDLFAAWQAAFCSEAGEDRDRLSKALLDSHADSREARLVQTLFLGDEATTAAIDALASEFETPPLELSLLRATRLVRTDALAAKNTLEQMAMAAPAVVAIRHLAACACIAYLQGAEGLPEADRVRGRAQLDNHLQWLVKNAPEGDSRRPLWRQWLAPK